MRDWNGERILKNARKQTLAFGRRRKPKSAKTENRFCDEFSLKTHGKPGPQTVLRTHPEKNCGIIE